jgi:hypothetical protein
MGDVMARGRECGGHWTEVMSALTGHDGIREADI